MIDLSTLIKGKSKKPPRIVLYGPHGIGKSTLANEAGAVIVPTEDGLGEIDLKAGSFPIATDLDDIYAALGSLAEQDHQHTAVAIDTIDWLEKLIFAKVCKKSGVESIELAAGGYGKGYTEALNEWYRLFETLEYLRNEKKMAILLLAHCRIETYANPLGEPYDRYVLDLHSSKRVDVPAKVMEWSDAVLFANYKVITKKVDGSDKKPVRHGFGSGERVLYTEERPAFLAKNRYGLPETMPFEWKGLIDAISR